jgi:hypothetical protein
LVAYIEWANSLNIFEWIIIRGSYDEDLMNMSAAKYLPILVGGGKFDHLHAEEQVHATKGSTSSG